MTNQFDPTAWNTGADLLDAAREAWETSSFQAAQSQPVSGNGSVPVDALLAKKTAELKLKWYDLIGEVGVAMGSDVSKMRDRSQLRGIGGAGGRREREILGVT